jgi:flagellar assembly protein FliH
MEWEQIAAVVEVEPFAYAAEPGLQPSCAEWSPTELDAQGNPELRKIDVPAPPHFPTPDFEERLAEEARRSFEAGRDRGRQEGRAAEREAHLATGAEEAAQRAEQIRHLMESFTAQRDGWLEQAEHEAVKLALAVAARILRREAQMDPLLLLGAMRVALGQLASSSEAQLHVPARDADLWREAVALLPSRTLKPRVIAVDEMRLGDCALETDLGSADLGVRAQLSEIESGFFDRPRSAPVATAAEQS